MRGSVLPMLCFAGCLGPSLRPPWTGQVARTESALERGRYLGEHVCACLYCHSPHDWSKFTGANLPGHEGEGGACLGPEADVNGRVCAQNLTPAGLGAWTDGEILRALREGVSRDGRALFPSMPYAYFRYLSDEDAQAIVVWLRSLPEKPAKPPPTHVNFPTSLLIGFLPEPLETPVPPPADKDKGEYLVRIAACDFCHTNQPRGAREKGFELAGGFVLNGPWGRVVSPNLTPHPTGLGRFTRDEFISRFKSFALYDPFAAPRMPSGATVMPWVQLSGMSEDDLGAIYDWLRTIRPVDRAVAPFGG